MALRYDHRLEEGEMWLARRLWLAALFPGLTTPEQRRDHMRQRIRTLKIAEQVAGRRRGQPLTFGQAFSDLYGETL